MSFETDSKNKAELINYASGKEMFVVARTALEAMAGYINGYESAVANKNKFCHGFGVFQRDLQFFVEDPGYFIGRRYEIYSETLAHCLKELTRGMYKLGLDGHGPLSDADFCKVAIAYNTGDYKTSKGLKQGHFDGTKYYGEHIADYLVKVRSVPIAKSPPELSLPGRYIVIARSGLKLRSGPGTDYDWDRILSLGTELVVIRANLNDTSWVLVDLEGDSLVDGFVHSGFLGPIEAHDHETVAEPG
ncbi:SH3 domain-containing protein [Aurantimonas sp. C2-6-R+9]|uniref:SH3 domain-containing protein n=1 Tax=unclassified Aurantimonas TaxID=2638230 RepID=UPI002E189FFA|nr:MULTISPECIES: SH3 domain-containing protein [unclassified Aurantimonas]MEC5292504.1 SH3 domain-containing protein [Aurantimonas sp. C2-3-R2]MEC5382759.1 SH3 domain-containing protein [Aurantimonas sp. C2-6-R+9]MEC5413536.1 SH3 domain-containing protein [Aurantimonas sp. C2-4-R8]